MDKKNKMENFKNKCLLFLIICFSIIFYPFITIKYFETYSVLLIVVKYFSIFILLVVGRVTCKFYSTIIYDGKEEHNQISRNKSIIRTVISILFFVFFSTLLLGGIIFSLVILTNKYFGKSDPIKIREIITNYHTSMTKNGRIQHYVRFKHPKSKTLIHLEVYEPFKVGDTFEKDMKIGYWGILYSEK